MKGNKTGENKAKHTRQRDRDTRSMFREDEIRVSCRQLVSWMEQSVGGRYRNDRSATKSWLLVGNRLT